MSASDQPATYANHAVAMNGGPGEIIIRFSYTPADQWADANFPGSTVLITRTAASELLAELTRIGVSNPE